MSEVIESLNIPEEFIKNLDELTVATKADCKAEGMSYSVLDDISNLGELYYAPSPERIKPEFHRFYDFVHNNLETCVAYLSVKGLEENNEK